MARQKLTEKTIQNVRHVAVSDGKEMIEPYGIKTVAASVAKQLIGMGHCIEYMEPEAVVVGASTIVGVVVDVTPVEVEVTGNKSIPEFNP